MNFVERIFLGVFVLFSIFILFVFSLYFDLEDILRGAVARNEPISSRAVASISIDSMRKLAMSKRRGGAKSVVVPMHTYIPTSDGESMLRYFLSATAPRLPSVEDRKREYRRYLERKGCKDADYIRMMMGYRFCEEQNAVLARAEDALLEGRVEEAIETLESLLSTTDKSNLLLVRDILMRLQQAYLAAGRIDEAEKLDAKIIGILERITRLKLKGLPDYEVEERRLAEEDLARLEERRRNLKKYFESYRKFYTADGRPKPLSAGVKAALREELSKRSDIPGDFKKDFLKALEGM